MIDRTTNWEIKYMLTSVGYHEQIIKVTKFGAGVPTHAEIVHEILAQKGDSMRDFTHSLQILSCIKTGV